MLKPREDRTLQGISGGVHLHLEIVCPVKLQLRFEAISAVEVPALAGQVLPLWCQTSAARLLLRRCALR